MKKFLLSLLFSSAAFAHFGVGVEPIYWRPCSSFYHYGARFPSLNPLITRHLVLNPDYDWGIRVFASYERNCYFAMVDWTHLKSESSATERGPDLYMLPFALNNAIPQERIKASLEHDYDKVNLRVGRVLCGNFYAYVGGKWVKVEESRLARTVPIGNDESLQFIELSSFDGGGVEVGIGGETPVWCWFGISGRLGISGLIGERSSSAYGPTLSANRNLTLGTQIDPSSTTCVLGIEGRVGVYGETRCGWLRLRGEVGYEMDYYFNALRFRKPTLSPNDTFASDIGFGGIYITLEAGF